MAPQIKLTGYEASTRNRLMTPELASKLGNFLPERIQLRPEWRLKYSLEQHGASLTTFYEHAAKAPTDHHQRGSVLIIKDQKGGIFGAYANVELKPVPNGTYQGNSDCFLWKANDKSGDSVAVYSYTGKNDFLVLCNPKYLAFGSGDGHPGLFVDHSVDSGRSLPSFTFDNEILSTQGERFSIIALELWEI